MGLLFLAMWVGWVAYWAIAARGTKATLWREPPRADWLHYALAWIGTIALVVPRATLAILARPFLPASLIGTGLASSSPHSARSRSRHESRSREIGAPRSRSKKTTR